MDELDVESIFKFKVDDLKAELSKRGLAKSGSKPDLQERLLQYVTSKLYANDSTDVLEDVDDTKLEASLEAELDASDHTEEDPAEDEVEEDEEEEDRLSKQDSLEEGDEFVSLDELPKDTSAVSNDATAEEFPLAEPTEAVPVGVETSSDVATVEEETPAAKADVDAKPKFCRVTITSPVVSDKAKKESRGKRFSDSLGSAASPAEESESDKKKARLGRFSSTNMAKGEAVTEDDVEKIKKRAERFGAVSSILSSPASGGGAKDRLETRKERFADPTLKKRQERFGVPSTTSLNMTSDMEARKQSRLAKFGALG